jgi:hypothetical protein
LSVRGCQNKPWPDLTDDCQVSFADVQQFVYYWLLGK